MPGVVDLRQDAQPGKGLALKKLPCFLCINIIIISSSISILLIFHGGKLTYTQLIKPDFLYFTPLPTEHLNQPLYYSIIQLKLCPKMPLHAGSIIIISKIAYSA